MIDLADRLFSYSELYGPFACDRCGNYDAYYILISEAELSALVELDRYDQSMIVLREGIGEAMCNDCFDKMLEPKAIELDDED